MDKIIKKIVSNIIFRDYPPTFRLFILEELRNDFFKNKNTNIYEKVWSYRRGFLSKKKKLLSLNNNNYKNYVSDFSYYKSHPINGYFSRWIDCKLTVFYILQPFKEYMPEHYYHIYKKNIINLVDCPKNMDKSIGGIIELIKLKENLALKLTRGSLGNGFYKISYYKDKFHINDEEVSIDDIVGLLEQCENYIVTEYLNAHKELSNIYSITPNAIRLMTIYDKNDGPQITGGFIRFGTKQTGMIEHVHVGGICANIDIETGRFYNPILKKNDKMVKCEQHPDTGENISGILPNWDLIQIKVKEMCDYIPQVTYIGWDIVITDDGFKILEANSFQSIDNLQYYNSINSNKYSKNFFEEYII